MAPRKSSLQQHPSWRKSIFHCIVALTVSCSITDISCVEARTPSSWSAARSALPNALRQKNDDTTLPKSSSSRWGGTRSRLSHNPASFIQTRSSSSLASVSQNGKKDDFDIVMAKLRGGSASDTEDESEEEEYDDTDDEEEESTDDEYDSDNEYETESSEEDEYDSDEEEEVTTTTKSSTSLKSSLLSKSQDAKTKEELVEYDDLLTPPAMQQFAVSIGVMMLANRIDITNAKAVRIARFAFLAYIISVEVFLLYAYFRAKSINDRTEIEISNPLGSLASQLVPGGAAGAGGMVKALADQVLSSQTTVLEYDLKQVKNMNGGLLFPMVFLYFLHFKMKQVQPLLMQTATGVLNLVYSPLFQVYVLGRNLERPFKPPVNPMMEAMQNQQDGVGGEEEGGDGDAVVSEEENEEEDVDDEEDEDGSDEEASDEEDESDEYDSDDE